MANNYFGLYRSKALRLDNATTITAQIPQLFGDTAVSVDNFVGAPPTVFPAMGWVSFWNGDPEHPVWFGATGSSNGNGGGGGGGGGITTEDAVDAVAAALVEGAGIDIVYNDMANTITVAATGGGAGITAEDAVDAVAAALVEGVGIDLAYNDVANTITITADKTEMSLAKGDVGLGNVDNTSDANKPVSTAQETALGLKADKATTVTTTAPLTGSGTLGANLTLGINTFTSSVKGAVPPPTTATGKYLKDDGTWATPAGGSADALWVGTSAPSDPNIELWYDTDEAVGSVLDLATADARYLQLTGGELSGGLDITGYVNILGASSDLYVEGHIYCDRVPFNTNDVTNKLYVDAVQTKYPVVSTVSGTSYTLVLLDVGNLILFTSGTAVTVTIPPQSSVAFSAGVRIDIVQMGAGKVSVAPGAGVTLNPTTTRSIRAQYSTATVIRTAPDTWLLAGDISA